MGALHQPYPGNGHRGRTAAGSRASSAYDGVPGTHQWYVGTPHPWEFARVWHLELSWQELPGLRGHRAGPSWQPGAGGMCLHTVVLDPRDPGRMFVAISAAGVLRTDDAGKIEARYPAATAGVPAGLLAAAGAGHRDPLRGRGGEQPLVIADSLID